MTDKEMAEKWVDKEISLGTSMYNPQIEHYCKQAFLAGLKAGKDTNVSTKWHKVSDGDLPKDNRLVLIYMVNGNTTMGIYYVGAWREICNCKELSGVLAWCEIPQFKE